MAEEMRLTAGSVVRLIGAGLNCYARVELVETAVRLVVDVTGVHVRCHASRTYSERTHDESGLRYELRIDVASAEVAASGAPYPLAPAPTPTPGPRRPRRPRRPRAEALPVEPAAVVPAPTPEVGV